MFIPIHPFKEHGLGRAVDTEHVGCPAVGGLWEIYFCVLLLGQQSTKEIRFRGGSNALPCTLGCAWRIQGMSAPSPSQKASGFSRKLEAGVLNIYEARNSVEQRPWPLWSLEQSGWSQNPDWAGPDLQGEASEFADRFQRAKGNQEATGKKGLANMSSIRRARPGFWGPPGLRAGVQGPKLLGNAVHPPLGHCKAASGRRTWGVMFFITLRQVGVFTDGA